MDFYCIFWIVYSSVTPFLWLMLAMMLEDQYNLTIAQAFKVGLVIAVFWPIVLPSWICYLFYGGLVELMALMKFKRKKR